MKAFTPALTLVLLALLSACSPKGLPLKTIDSPPSELTTNEFMRTAIYNGMARDNFPVDLADDILGLPGAFFVTKCPICRPVEAGIRDYSEAEPVGTRVRTPKEILEGIVAEDLGTRQEAFRDLVGRYTKAEMARLKLNSEDKAALEKRLAADRKKGMTLKQDDFGKFCPSCDGACEVRE